MVKFSESGSLSTSDEALQQSADVLPNVICVVAPIVPKKCRKVRNNTFSVDWKDENLPLQDKNSGL